MRTAVFNYIECDYNRWRHHNACSGLSLKQFENENLAQGCVHITWVGSQPKLRSTKKTQYAF